MNPTDLATAALSWLGVRPGAAGADVDNAELVAGAVAGWVDSLPAIRTTTTTAAGGATTTSWADSTKLGAVMLTARLIRRRNSPAGIEAFTTDGAAYVQRQDPDVALLLRLGRFAPPRTG